MHKRVRGATGPFAFCLLALCSASLILGGTAHDTQCYFITSVEDIDFKMTQPMEQPELQMAVDSTSIENGAPQQPEVDSVPVEELERELPLVTDGQIELSDVLSRVVQAIYAELTEMAETYVRVDSGLFILH